jgi:acetyl esterase
LLVLAGFDPLIDEGHAYADRLADEAGAAVEVMEHADLVHGFVVMTGAVERARAAGLQLSERLRDRLA